MRCTHRKSSVGPAVGGAVGGVILLLLLLLAALWFKRRAASRGEASVENDVSTREAGHPRIPSAPPSIVVKDSTAVLDSSSGLASARPLPSLPTSETELPPTYPAGRLMTPPGGPRTAQELHTGPSLPSAHSGPLSSRRASTLTHLTQMNVPPEMIVQVLDAMREDDPVEESSRSLSPLSHQIPTLPRGAASPAPPGYDFKE